MSIRVCFSKYDRLRFLGHLDVMRFFQHAIARSGIPIAYSQGYHPHMIMSFAQPLALSMTSDGEYFDCELSAAEVSEQDLRDRLQNAMCDGFFIRSVTVLPEREPNTRKQTGMSQIAGAMYLCEPLEGCEEALSAAVTIFADCNSFCIEKKAKNGVRTVDVRAGLHAIGIISAGSDGRVDYLLDDGIFDTPSTLANGWGFDRTEHAAHRHDAPGFLFAVDAGSENNISTELIQSALRQIALQTNGKNEQLPERCMSSHRMELYRIQEGHMISLAE